MEARLHENRASITEARKHLSIADLTKTLLSENKVKECPELSEMRRRFEKQLRLMEDEIARLRGALDHEVDSHNHCMETCDNLTVRFYLINISST